MDEIKPNNAASGGKENPMIENNNQDTWQDVKTYAGKLWIKISEFWHDITDIKEGMDEQGTRDSIQKNIQIKGSNIWLLMSAIMVASLGLNLNSPAVIIGAMLISPLMSPILGIGLSIGINDRSTLYQSMYHFGVAIVVSLLTSTIYFWFTPLGGEATNEILARTSPTLLDVLVAFFGGIAGIVSGSRIEKSNAIPGVAIATALLPPLCVSGYGLANADWHIFFNSLYLFFLNSVFIALATYLIVRLLGFRPKKYVNKGEQTRSTFMVIVFVLLMIVPSVFILRGVIAEVQRERTIKTFVREHFEKIDRDVSFRNIPILVNGDLSDSSVLRVTILGDTISQDSIRMYNFLLRQQNIGKTSLKVIQTFDPNIRQLTKNISQERNNFQIELAEKTAALQMTKIQLAKLKDPAHILKNIEILEPQIENLQYSNSVLSIDSSRQKMPTLIVKWKEKTKERYKKDHVDRLGQYVQQELGLDTIQVIQQ